MPSGPVVLGNSMSRGEPYGKRVPNRVPNYANLTPANRVQPAPSTPNRTQSDPKGEFPKPKVAGSNPAPAIHSTLAVLGVAGVVSRGRRCGWFERLSGR